jgi:hypothetical protein
MLCGHMTKAVTEALKAAERLKREKDGPDESGA